MRTLARMQKQSANLISFVVDAVECNAAHLLLETSKPNKLPVDIAIAHLELTRKGGISATSPLDFTAEVTVPKPVGTAHATGTIGPWNQSDPGESALQGKYTFEDADLSTLKGIGGTLNSTGNYEGTLRDLVVDGNADTPDFELTHFGHKMALHTHFSRQGGRDQRRYVAGASRVCHTRPLAVHRAGTGRACARDEPESFLADCRR